MKKFIYNGIYYPVIGDSNGWVSSRTKQVWEHRVGGWINADKWWSFSIGIKCRLSNPERPYKQFVIDAIKAHKNMKIVTRWYDDMGNKLKEAKDREQLEDGWAITSVFTKKDEHIGDIRDAYQLSFLTDFKTCGGDSNQICIGWDKENQVAYGWSHRAMVGFQKGDKVFHEKFGNETTLYTQHGRKTIRNYADAMKSALEFARSVS